MALFLIANDSFKDCLPAREVGQSLAFGIRKSSHLHKTIRVPLADGGEGSLEALSTVLPLERCELYAHTSDGQLTKTYYLFDQLQKTAYIEMAKIVGLELVEENNRILPEASSYGLGEVIADAITSGAKEIIVFVGGSATNDMGLGMCQALGVKFFGENLSQYLSGKDLSSILDYTLPDISNFPKLTVISDVNSPLYGKSGASFVYGKQKGGTFLECKIMDTGMRKLALLIQQKTKINLQEISGSGAAGGVAAGLLGFFGASIRPGANYLLDFLQIKNKIKKADVIVTGEGKLDTQTGHGKLISALGKLSQKYRKPLIAVCGLVDLTEEEKLGLGISEAYSLAHRNHFAPYDASTTEQDLLEVGMEIGRNYLENEK